MSNRDTIAKILDTIDAGLEQHVPQIVDLAADEQESAAYYAALQADLRLVADRVAAFRDRVWKAHAEVNEEREHAIKLESRVRTEQSA